jgi:L-iditol 2-dehydrogenase
MRAARLHGPRDLRVENVPHPGEPGPGEVLLRVTAGGICGSDLHTYNAGRIGDTVLRNPLILGHEFAAVVEAVGADAQDGEFKPLKPGTPVAVDPAQSCGRCVMCERGQPNLCEHLHFCGLCPDDGCFAEYIRMPAKCCFPVPAEFDPALSVMLEPLGIALHAVDLARVKVGSSVALIGAGPVGLCILECLRLAGADLCQ